MAKILTETSAKTEIEHSLPGYLMEAVIIIIRLRNDVVERFARLLQSSAVLCAGLPPIMLPPAPLADLALISRHAHPSV